MVEDPFLDVIFIDEESKPSNVKLGFFLMRERHHLDGLFYRLITFSFYVGMQMMDFEEEIISLLRKMDERRGHSIKPFGRKRKPIMSSCFVKGI